MGFFDSLFEHYSHFMATKGKYLLLVWIVFIVVLSPYALTLSHIVSYSINVPSSNNESQTAENLVSTQFRGYNHSYQSNTAAYLVLEGSDVLSPAFYQEFVRLNETLFNQLGSQGLNSSTSIYGLEYKILLGFINGAAKALNYTQMAVNKTSVAMQDLAENLTKQSEEIQAFSSNISTLASAMWNLTHAIENISLSSYRLEQNLTQLNHGLYRLQANVDQVVLGVNELVSKIYQTNAQLYALGAQVNQSLQLIYGLPLLYVDMWLAAASSSNYTEPTSYINQQANATLFSLEEGFAGYPLAKAYYELFYSAWWNQTSTKTAQQVAAQALAYADQAVAQVVGAFVTQAGLSAQQAQFFQALAASFNITDFRSIPLVDEFTLQYATMGLSAEQAAFAEACFSLGPNPTQQQVDSLALQYATMGLSAEQAAFVQQAFYGVKDLGLEGFVIQYFEQQLNEAYPNISRQVQQELAVNLTQLLRDAYSLGNPPNQSLLEGYTTQILANALPKAFANTLEERFNITAQTFMRSVVGFGYPPSNASVEGYVVQLFSKSINFEVKPNTTTFLEEVYTLGQNPTKAATLGLAVNTTLAALSAEAQQNITKTFGLTPEAYVQMVAELGYPPNTAELANLTTTLFLSYFELNGGGLADNITQNYNVSLQTFIEEVYASDQPPTANGSLSLSAKLTYRLIVAQEKNQPFLAYNAQTLNTTIKLLIHDHSYSTLTQRLMAELSLQELPVRPVSGVLYQLVDPSLNTTVVTVTFTSPPSDSTLSLFEHMASSFNTSTFKVYYTSSQIISNALQSVVFKSGVYSIPFGLAAAIVITGVFFWSPVAALIPLLVFGIGAAVGFGLIHLYLGYYQHTTLSYISPIIILILSLGLVTDYSVLILNRFRQELDKGEKEALAKATRWGGEAVFTSGLTVIISYIVLSAAHIPLFSDVGTANAIIVVSILASALAFLPPLLAILGRRVFWPKKRFEYKPSVFAKATRSAISHPKSVLATLLAITLVAAVVASTLPVNINFFALTPGGPGKTGLDQISNNFGGSILIPTYVVVELPAKLSTGGNLFNQTELSVLSNLTQTIRDSKGVVAVYGPTTPYNYSLPYVELDSFGPSVRSQYASAILNYVSIDNSSVYFEVIFAGDPFGNTVLNEAAKLRDTLHSVTPAGYTVYVGGSSLDSKAVLDYVFAVLPKMIVLLISAIYVVLLIQLRSAFTPLRLIATILSSIAWTLLFAWLIFYKIGGTSVFVFAPLFLVTTMLGVGVDYDIFMMTRVREEARRGYTDEDAIVRTSETTAGVVITLGLILSSVFFGLTLTQIELVQQIGLSLAIAIILDTFVVWLFYVPAIMVLAKRLNWWPGDPRKEPLQPPNKMQGEPPT